MCALMDGSMGGVMFGAPYGANKGIRDACGTVDILNGCSSGLLVV